MPRPRISKTGANVIPSSAVKHKLHYCPDHQTEPPMKYNPAEDRYECNAAGCMKFLRRPMSFKRAFGGDQRPGVYRGELEIVIDDDGLTYLYLVDVNGLVDITRLVEGNQ